MSCMLARKYASSRHTHSLMFNVYLLPNLCPLRTAKPEGRCAVRPLVGESMPVAGFGVLVFVCVCEMRVAGGGIEHIALLEYSTENHRRPELLRDDCRRHSYEDQKPKVPVDSVPYRASERASIAWLGGACVSGRVFARISQLNITV